MEKKIKIMHFVSGLKCGGVEEMLYNYCKFLNHDKYDFVIVFQHEPVQTCIAKVESIGCTTVRITGRDESLIRNIKDSLKIINREKPSIVHAHMNLMNFCALYAAKKNGVKVRISHSHIAERNRGVVIQLAKEFFKYLCIRYSTALFSCGEEAGIFLYGKKRLESGKVKLVENAIDLEKFNIDPKLKMEIKKDLGLNENFVVGHVGRFSNQKNHTRLLDIFKRILDIKRNAILLLVGTGELESVVRIKAQSLGILNKVIFYGTTQEMNKIYSLMDVFVFPSLYEGFPVVSVEIQAANVPAVFSSAITPTCKITEAIAFMDLECDDEIWARKVIDHFNEFKPCDLEELRKQFDIRERAHKLDIYYREEIERCLSF